MCTQRAYGHSVGPRTSVDVFLRLRSDLSVENKKVDEYGAPSLPGNRYNLTERFPSFDGNIEME